MKKEIICIVCPRGCHIQVEGENGITRTVEGSGCKRGRIHAELEFAHPVRILTSTVKIAGVQNDLLPVRSSRELPKEKLFECMDVIRKYEAQRPVARCDVLIPNICDTGIDIVATKNYL